MSETEMRCMHDDLEILKRDVAIIKHILVEEGELTDEAVARLDKARKTPINEFVKL